MLRAAWNRYRLDFRFLAVTSRDSMRSKDTYYIKVWDDAKPDIYGIGEAALFRGLSHDDRPGYEGKLTEVCNHPDGDHSLAEWPSIRMGLDCAMRDLSNGGRRILYPGNWTEGKSSLPINGLVWMGTEEEMVARMREKVAQGFSCIKIKIGGIDFERELAMLRALREVAPHAELRLDANGAFSPTEALGRLERLAVYGIHSIEQPIRQGQPDEMARICRESPIPIALDEELIGVDERRAPELLGTIRPAYIILKPTLVGGFGACDRWIETAQNLGIGWWATSALESDIGLNAIAQWTASHSPTMPQGLGTGQLYTNNIPSPLKLDGDRLSYDKEREWKIPALGWN